MSVEYNVAVWSPTSKIKKLCNFRVASPSQDKILRTLSIHPSLDDSWDQGLVCSEEEFQTISGEAVNADIYVHRPEQATRWKQRKAMMSRQEAM